MCKVNEKPADDFSVEYWICPFCNEFIEDWRFQCSKCGAEISKLFIKKEPTKAK